MYRACPFWDKFSLPYWMKHWKLTMKKEIWNRNCSWVGQSWRKVAVCLHGATDGHPKNTTQLGRRSGLENSSPIVFGPSQLNFTLLISADIHAVLDSKHGWQKPWVVKAAGAHEYNYNNGVFLTLFLYFSYGAKASNLRCTVVSLVTYCAQNMKCQKLVLMLGALCLWYLTSTRFVV